MARQRRIVTQQSRAQIMRIMRECNGWTGSRAGVKMTFRYDLPDFRGDRVIWTAVVNGTEHNGRAPSVYDAIQAIETEAAR